MMTGVWLRSGSARMRRQTSSPSTPGSMMSSSTTSKLPFFSAANPRSPSPATVTSTSFCSRYSATSEASLASSSMRSAAVRLFTRSFSVAWVMRAHEGRHLVALAGVERVVCFRERLHDGVAGLLHLGLTLRLQRGELGLIDLVGGEHGYSVVEVRGVIVEVGADGRERAIHGRGHLGALIGGGMDLVEHV